MRASWSFVLHKERSGRYSVRARVRLQGRPVDTGTGVTIDSPADWDARRQRVRAASNAAAVANLTLTAVDGALSDLIARAAIDRRTPTREEAAACVMEAAGRVAPPEDSGCGLFAAFDKFTAVCGRDNSWTAATFRKFATLRRHLWEYDHGLRLDTLTADRLAGFVAYLTAKGYRNSYTLKLWGFLRWFLRWSAGAGLYGGHLHQTWRPRLKCAKEGREAVVYLTIPELERLEAADLTEHPDLAAVRDVFVFCCYSGLRFSDAKALKESDIHGGCIHVVTKKTADPLSIELNCHTRSILDRWRGRLGGRALPAISNQNTNYRLKELGRLAGIGAPVRSVHFVGSQRFDETRPKWEVLTTHAARRTFVVTALTLGIPAEVIMKWTGHSDFDSMRTYMAIVDKLKREAMAAFDTIAPPRAPLGLGESTEKGGAAIKAEPPETPENDIW